MKRLSFNIAIYTFFILAFLGAFASMARNAYGTDLIGIACLGFAAIFILDTLQVFVRDRSKIHPVRTLENLLLSALSIFFALRVFYVRFEGIEIVVSAIGFTLAIIYLLKRISFKENGRRAILSSLYLGSLSLFFLSLGLATIQAIASQAVGMLGFGLLVVAIALSIFKSDLAPRNAEEEPENSLSYLFSLGRNGVVIAIAFALMSAYIGLTQVKILPELYTNAKPQKYIQLVKNAESGLEEPVDGKYQHEEFARKMDEFLEKHGD